MKLICTVQLSKPPKLFPPQTDGVEELQHSFAAGIQNVTGGRQVLNRWLLFTSSLLVAALTFFTIVSYFFFPPSQGST